MQDIKPFCECKEPDPSAVKPLIEKVDGLL
jgi:hypothetical protein